MKLTRGLSGLLLVISVLLTSCAPSSPPSSSPSGGAPSPAPSAAAPSTPKRMTAAIRGNPTVLAAKLNIGNNFIGTGQMERLVNAGLTVPDTQDLLHAELAEAVPTLENGLWKVFPDGRMETTWKLRPNVKWHDGQPLTTDDLLFSAMVEQDRELAWVRNIAYDAVDQVQAPDAQTLVITWKRPFVEADTMFSSGNLRGLPLPKHLLERPYQEDKANFTQHPYWSQQFVGAGPFKLREWVPDSNLVLVANESYVLGRPKIDEIEVKLIPDTNAVMANILAGAAEYTMDGRTMPFEEARSLAAQWHDGRMEPVVGGVLTIFPQFLNTNPPIVANLQFRRALMYGMDRQEMVDTIQAGLAEVAHTYLGPDQPEFKEIERFVVKYEYDPRRAAQMIEGLGYSKGSDGMYQDSDGQKLVIPLHTTITNVNQKGTLAVADHWQRLGVGVETTVIPLQRQSDREYMFTLPAFHLIRIGRSIRSFQSLQGRESPTPENNFTGSNRGRYRSAELDTLIDQYFVTIPRTERMQVLGNIIHHETDQLALMRVFFDPESTMIGNRLRNVTGGTPWNSHEWDIG